MKLRMKQCTKCKKQKDIFKFSKNKSQKDGYCGWCKSCISDYLKNYGKDKKEKRKKYMKEYNKKYKIFLQKQKKEYRKKNPHKVKISKIQCYFKLTLKEATELYYKKLNGTCDICGKPESSKHFLLSIDHDHKTNKIRGILCNACNKALGGFQDDVQYLKNAIKYLKENNNV